MSRRQRADPEEKPGAEEVNMEEEEPQEPPPETRRTRSGRAVRKPAALLDSMEPIRTPSRRTKRTAVQELPPAAVVVEEEEEEEANTVEQEPKHEAVPEEKTDVSVEQEPEHEAVPEETTGVSAKTGSDNAASEAAGGDTPQARPAAPAETAPVTTETVPPKKPRLGPSVQQTPVIPLGKPKSGRVWKDRSKQRFSALVRDKPLCSSWQKKMEAKREKEQVKQFSQQLKEEKAKQKEDKRKRREDNLKRRTENERKAEIVQVIRNTTKIKRMKKKQLRKIEKRDTLALLQKTQKQRTQNIKAKGQKNNTGKDLT